jgi:hypothetical protein
MLGNDYAVRAQQIRGAKNRAEVARVFDAVERDQKRRFVTCGCNQVFEVRVAVCTEPRNHALVACALACCTVEDVAITIFDADAGRTRLVDDLRNWIVCALACAVRVDPDRFDGFGAIEELAHRTDAVDTALAGSTHRWWACIAVVVPRRVATRGIGPVTVVAPTTVIACAAVVAPATACAAAGAVSRARSFVAIWRPGLAAA